MKQLIIALALLLFPVGLSAKKVYCEVLLQANRLFFPSSNYALVVGGKDFGYIGNEEGKKISFMNAMDAVNYMTTYGWRVVTVHALVGFQIGGGISVNCDSYLMERDIDDNATILSDMIIIPDKRSESYKRSENDDVY